MKKLTFKNLELIPIFTFLQELKLKANKASRGRTQLLKRLEEKNKEFNESLLDIRKEFFVSDEEGELVLEGDHFLFKDTITEEDKVVFKEQIFELENENFEIYFGEYSTRYESLFTEMNSLEIELSGTEAYVYDLLMDAYEQNETKTKEEK